MCSQYEKGNRGITLLEVLVVAAIIALLLAILFPSISQARKQAARMSCMAHLRSFGNALNLERSENGHYPLRDPPPLDPDTFASLAHVTEPVIVTLLKGLLDDPRTLYCPTSLRNDPYALPPYIEFPGSGQSIYHWQTGQISYMYLAGVENRFRDADGEPTFDPEAEGPNAARSSDVVLVGDRVVELAPGKRHIPGSNHGHEGGWFYFTPGYTKWYPWKRLTAHPSHAYIWYWPRTHSHP